MPAKCTQSLIYSADACDNPIGTPSIVNQYNPSKCTYAAPYAGTWAASQVACAAANGQMPTLYEMKQVCINHGCTPNGAYWYDWIDDTWGYCGVMTTDENGLYKSEAGYICNNKYTVICIN
jgi:hypothetical protein